MTDNDDELLERLRDRLDFKSEGEGSSAANDDSTEQKEQTDTESESESDTESESGTETEAEADTDEKMGSMEEAIAAIAENTDEDVSESDVMDMLEPIVSGTESEGDYGDDMDEDDEEMEAETEAEAASDTESEADGVDVESIVEEKLDEMLDTKLDEHLSNAVAEQIEAKMDGVVTEDRLNDVVTAIGDEVEHTMQKAETGATPSPSGSGTDLSTDDLLSGGDDE